MISQIKDQWHFKVLRRILVDLLPRTKTNWRWPSSIYTKGTVHANTNKQFLFYSILQSLISNDFDSLTNPFDDDFPVTKKK